MPGGPPKFGEMTWLRKGGGCPIALAIFATTAAAVAGSGVMVVAYLVGG